MIPGEATICLDSERWHGPRKQQSGSPLCIILPFLEIKDIDDKETCYILLQDMADTWHFGRNFFERADIENMVWKLREQRKKADDVRQYFGLEWYQILCRGLYTCQFRVV